MERKYNFLRTYIGGLFLFADYYKRHTLKKVYYRCPQCGILIEASSGTTPPYQMLKS